MHCSGMASLNQFPGRISVEWIPDEDLLPHFDAIFLSTHNGQITSVSAFPYRYKAGEKPAIPSEMELLQSQEQKLATLEVS